MDVECVWLKNPTAKNANLTKSAQAHLASNNTQFELQHKKAHFKTTPNQASRVIQRTMKRHDLKESLT